MPSFYFDGHFISFFNKAHEYVDAFNNVSISDDLLGNPNDSYNTLENILMEAKAKHFQPREVNFDK